MDQAERAVVFRFIRLRCPLCGHTSPVTDQTSDVRRELLSRWWQKHKEAAHPYPSPTIEVATPTEADSERAVMSTDGEGTNDAR